MNWTIRVLRAIVIASAVMSCWFVGGAAYQEPGQSGADLAERLGVTHFTVQDFAVDASQPGKQISAEMVLAGRQRRLVMEPYSVCAPDMLVLEQLADGSLRSVEAPPSRTYRGTIEGEPDSLIAASLNEDGTLTGAIWLGGEQWGVQPLRELEAGAPVGRHVIYRQRDVVLPPGVCGVIDEVRREQPAEGGIAGSGLSGGVQVDIAFDADFEFFVLNGSSTTNTVNDIAFVMNVVEAMYQRDLGIAFRITATIVRTAEPDPYSATTGSALLNQFQQHWIFNQGAIVRDCAQLMTGKTNLGPLGIAFLASICTNQNGGPYSVVESRFTLNILARTSVSAHEIGHNFSAQHCDGGADCGVMCSNIGGCASNLTGWGAFSINQIINWRNSPSCVAVLSPVGACCVGSTCTQVSSAECATAGGTWSANTPCTTRTTYTINPGTAIPDANAVGITSVINVPASYPISDVNVRLNIPHTRIGDLIVDLQHNGGPFTRIVDRIGVPVTPFGCDANNLNVWLDDESPAGSIENACSLFFPFQPSPGMASSSGPSYFPNAPLTAFNGQNAQGTWTLKVYDFSGGELGSLASWSLNIENANSGLCLPVGACCMGSACTQTVQAVCASSGGTWTSGQPCYLSTTSSTIPSLAIPDNSPSGVSHNLNVGLGLQLHDLNLRLVINHPFVGDLIVKLSRNGGPFVTVIDRPGVPASAFGCEGNNYDIVLDDEAIAGAIEDICGNPVNPTSPPNYSPLNPLSFFDGQNMAGTWTLNVADVIPLNTGTLVSWSLIGEDNKTNFCAVNDCPPDIAPPGGDGAVNVDDLLAVIGSWGPCPAPPATCPANVVTTGGSATNVDVDDLLAIIGAWGPCP